MRHLSESDFTSKKQKVFSKKAKRFDRNAVRRSISNGSCSLDDDDSDVKSVSRKNVLSLSGNDEITLMKSREKKLANRRSSIAKWDVTELSPSSQYVKEKSADDTEKIRSIRVERKRKVPPAVTHTVENESIGTGKIEKLSPREQNRLTKAASTNRKEVESDLEDVEGDTTIGSDVQQSAFEGPIVTTEEVEKAVRALLKLIKVTAVKRGRNLFESEAESVHMQINSIRIPRTPTRRIRFSLPHPLVTETSDICLFVPDLKKGPRIDHEPTVAHYRELLDQHGVKQITQVMPVRQLKDEYSQFEMRRRLCGTYDFFLADGRICGPINPLLGKEFHVKRKLPTPVNLQSKNLKKAIEKALSKTALTVTPHGDSTLVKIGHSHHSPEQLTENIMSVVEELKTRFPGGWHNIRHLSLKTSKSLRVPFYVTMKSANSVKVPVEKPRRPKAAVAVEDELSTIPGARVVVLPSGEVIVKKEANSEDSASEVESEGELDDDDDDEEEEEDEDADSETEKVDTKEVSKGAIKPKAKVTSDDENGDSDSDVEAAEDEYLSGWMQELGESEKHNDEEDEPAKKKSRHQDDSTKHKKKTKVGKSLNTTKSMKKTKKTQDTKESEKKKKTKK
ncbi:ribosomal L1 domain-containing protein 1-like [Schistocerca gregaria]|uniref:ribosomal L1 domain-containing protein 1-like n=1 Tax=Schistocerca gregaria TaxID=7010 RepID=UPI00211F31DC|nr:ribosomal L1 domain-containing protein 1-like [Schistocerca gregaria]